MHKKAYLIMALLGAAVTGRAQSTYIPFGSDNYYTLDRIETKSGRLCDSLRLNSKMESRKNAVEFIQKHTSALRDSFDSARYTSIDLYNMRQMISENWEWSTDMDGAIKSKKPLFKAIYKNQYDFLYVKTKDFFVVVNPVINGTTTWETNSPVIKGGPTKTFFNSHDIEVRGGIGKRLGFYTAFTDNQEQLPGWVYNYAVKDTPIQRMALPGGDYFLVPRTRSGNFDYLNASGYIDFAAIKDKVTVTFGSGKQFIGDGTTSLFLTDFSSNMPFLKLRARVWKLNYETLYMELTEQFKRGNDTLYPHKFATMHNISMNVTRWLNLGFFEAVVFNRRNAYEVAYLNPVVFTLSLNSFNGGGDKSLLGFYGKAIVAKRIQLYGQMMLNEFKSSEFFSNKGWYGNKWGIQAGAKYFDAFGVNNLDLQGEITGVRPYTYTAQDTLANYTNYNQPLADPLGSGYVKTIGMVRYQPVKNLTFTLKGMYYVHGNDTGRANMGNNIFNSYRNAQSIYGVKFINGPKSTCALVNLNISYQIRRNIYFDLGGGFRDYKGESNTYPLYSTTGVAYGPLKTTFYYFGLRINAPRRDYTFY